MAALGLIFATVLLSAAFIAIGLPTGAGIFLGLLVAGLGALALERRFITHDAPVLGISFLSFAAIAGIVSMVKAFPQVDGWIIGLSTLALELGILFGAIKLVRVVRSRPAR
jgi:hypothetical protein